MGIIISRTPLRVSIAGGGTDFEDFYREHGGCVISMGINKYVYVIIKKRFDNLIVLNYTQHEIVENVNNIKHDLIRECLKRYSSIHGGIEITTLADIPSRGSGLGSSSAITIGLLNALSHYINAPLGLYELATVACEIEINILKSPIGKQDQFACAVGGLNEIIFESGGITVRGFDLCHYKVANNLFLHYTDQTRHANPILKSQKNKIHANIEKLLYIKNLAQQTKESIDNCDYGAIGLILAENWHTKQELANGITNNKINEMVGVAQEKGASGCKITGAGGGGFLLSYVPPFKQHGFKIGMAKYRELPFAIDPYGSRIVFNMT